MSDFKVDWYGKDVLAMVDKRTPHALGAVAMQVLALSQRNIQANGQIDTGFMLNSGYVVTDAAGQQGQPGPSGQYRSAKTGRMVQRTAAPMVMAPKDGAAMHFAAEYTAYQEMRNSFMYRALEQVRPQVGALIAPVFRGGRP